MSETHVVVYAVMGVGLPVALYLIARKYKKQFAAWARFAELHGMQATNLRIKGSYEGYPLTIEEVNRGPKKQRKLVTVLRLSLGDSVPPEFSLELENLGDKMAKLIGRRTDTEIGHKAFDERFRLKNVSERLAGVLDNAAVQEQLHVMVELYPAFHIRDGWLEAELPSTPSTVDALEECVGPALLLAQTLEESSRHLQRLMKG